MESADGLEIAVFGQQLVSVSHAKPRNQAVNGGWGRYATSPAGAVEFGSQLVILPFELGCQVERRHHTGHSCSLGLVAYSEESLRQDQTRNHQRTRVGDA